MNITSKSQLGHSAHFAQIENVQTHSKLSIKHEIYQIHSQNLHQMRSQVSFKMRRQFENVQYKCSLLRLMVMVKLQSLGYTQTKIKHLIDHQVDTIQTIDSIQPKDLNFKASQITHNIINNLFIDDNAQIPVFQNPTIQKNSTQKQKQVASAITKGASHQILCSICYNISSKYCEQQCGHIFCTECMKGYIKENLKSGNYIVRCPQFDCHEFITQNTLKIILNPTELQRFLYFKHKHQKEMNPNNKFCSEPDCGELLQRIDDKLKCNKCFTLYCQICLHIYHDDNPCDIVLRNTIQNTYKSLRIKKCPSCKSPIQKLSGCNHMTCKKCKFQFCWLCLKKYSNHHYRYYNCFGCPGMQFEDQGQISIQRAKQFLLFLMLPLICSLMFFCFISAVPIYMVGQFMYKPCYWISSQHIFLQEQIVNNLCCCLGDLICGLLKWILFQPRSIINAVFLAPVKLTLIFCEQFCKICND